MCCCRAMHPCADTLHCCPCPPQVMRGSADTSLQELQLQAFQFEADVLSRMRWEQWHARNQNPRPQVRALNKQRLCIALLCRHPNVVTLLGYCLEPPACLLLELMPGEAPMPGCLLALTLFAGFCLTMTLFALCAATAGNLRGWLYGSSLLQAEAQGMATAGSGSDSFWSGSGSTGGQASSSVGVGPHRSLSELLQMGASVAQGLAFLHQGHGEGNVRLVHRGVTYCSRMLCHAASTHCVTTICSH